MKLSVNIYLVLLAFMFTLAFPRHLPALELSASANALNGFVAISQSVADYNYSPLIGVSGVEIAYHTPYSTPEIQTCGIYSAFLTKHSMFSTGMSYLMHDDYQWQDNYLGYAIQLPMITIGATQHLVMDYITNSSSRYQFDTDLGMRINYSQAFGDLQWQKSFTDKAEWVATVGTKPQKSTIIAIACKTDKNVAVWGVAGTHYISPAMGVYSSWQSNPARLGLGVEIKISQIKVIYGIRTHPELNLSHAIDLGYQW